MILRTLFLILFSFLAEISYSQKVLPGFYLIIPETKNCSNLLFSYNKEVAYCLADMPVIGASEFESVSEIKFNNVKKLQYIELKISNQAFQSLKTITQELNTDMALVVDGTVAGVFKNIGEATQTLPITAPPNSKEINWLLNEIKALIKK